MAVDIQKELQNVEEQLKKSKDGVDNIQKAVQDFKSKYAKTVEEMVKALEEISKSCDTYYRDMETVTNAIDYNAVEDDESVSDEDFDKFSDAYNEILDNTDVTETIRECADDIIDSLAGIEDIYYIWKVED